MDFTISIYQELIVALQTAGYQFFTFKESLGHMGDGKWIVLRHDVDLLPQHSLRIARIEHALGVRATYYFRAVPESWDEEVIRQIRDMGHEVGYHYESLTTTDGDVDEAYADFCKNLSVLRLHAPVATICMHGSPRSPYDSKDIWKKYDYRKLGIIGEPYLNTDFSQTFYLTDTGRRWDGYKVSVRDKIDGWQGQWSKQGLSFHSTGDIVRAVRVGRVPHRIMITTHPQRWNPFGISWLREFVVQNMKNVVKRIIILYTK